MKQREQDQITRLVGLYGFEHVLQAVMESLQLHAIYAQHSAHPENGPVRAAEAKALEAVIRLHFSVPQHPTDAEKCEELRNEIANSGDC